jgi:hypothetical protein
MPVRTSRIPVRANPSALSNPFLGIALTKAQKHAKSTQKKTLYRTKYMRCKQKQENKGREAYPAPGSKKCDGQYKKWQKHRGKVGERALKLSAKLDKKGKLSPELSEALQKDIEDSAAESLPVEELTEEEMFMMSDTLPEGEGLLEESDNTMLYAIGGLAVVGLLGGLLLLRK